jgi:DNA polymerase-3 subunit delta
MSHIEQIKQFVKNRSLPKVLALGGHEDALVDDCLALIRKSILSDDSGLNYERYEATELQNSQLTASLKTIPFLAPTRLVEVHSAEKLSADNVDSLIEYTKDPSPFSVLILVFSKVDRRNKLIAYLEKEKLFYDLKIDDKDALDYVIAEAKEHQIALDKELGQFLLLALDNDLVAIKNELKKLSLVFENRQPDPEELVEYVVGQGAQDVFKLARTISEGDLATSLKTLGNISRSGENALKFLGVIIWQFRILLNIRHCLDRGMPEREIRTQVSVFGDRFTWMQKVAQKRPTSFHINRLTRLLQCDLALKTQKISNPFSLIERIVYQSALSL